MSRESLSSITLATLDQYQQSGQHLVRAYRAGGERVVRGLHTRSGKMFGSYRAQDKAVELTLRGLESATRAAGQLVDGVTQRAAAVVQTMGRAVDGLEDKLVGAGLEFVGTLPRSASTMSLRLAKKLSKQSQRLSERVAGERPQASAASTARRPAAKKSARRSRSA